MSTLVPDEKPIEDMSALVFNTKDNPFKMIRTQMDLTQVQIATRTGLSKHAVLRNEQGMYVEPLPSLLTYYSEHFPVTTHTLRSQYEVFQLHQRELAGQLLGDLHSNLRDWRRTNVLSSHAPNHPLSYLRGLHGFNITSFSKALCLNQTVTTYFETNPVNQKTVPEQLTSALKDAGYTDDDIAYLRDSYQMYRELILGLKDVSHIVH